MGEEADGILASTNVAAEERKVYKTVLSKLDGFFDVRRNVIFERARFNRRNQREGESAEQFITQHSGRDLRLRGADRRHAA